MNLTAQTAKNLRDVYHGGNWAGSNLKDNLKDITWQQATTSVFNFNTIAALVFHTNYYVEALIKVLRGGPLDANDKRSFNCPAIVSNKDWQNLLDKTWKVPKHSRASSNKCPTQRSPIISLTGNTAPIFATSSGT